MRSIDPDPHGRLALYKYLTSDHSAEYIAIMDAFSATLLSDISIEGLRARLVEPWNQMSIQTLRVRCESLVGRGNLMPSATTPHYPTVAEYIHAQDRFQLTPLGGRLHRQVREILATVEGVREVARELLGQNVFLLGRINEAASGPGPADAESVAADTTTVFSNHGVFQDSLKEFYAYLGTVLSRYDLMGEEYLTFKQLLLQYVGIIDSDVARHTPVIVNCFTALEPWLDDVVSLLNSLPMAVNPDGSPGERLPGRRRADWDELAAWFVGSGPSELRSAADAALGQLITNARRMLTSAGTGASRRADLLRLAERLRTEDGPRAHQLFAAAFGMYAARHLGGTAEGPGQATPSVSWWAGAVANVPVTWRTRSGRGAGGGTHGRVPSVEAERAQEDAAATEEEAQRRAAAQLLLKVGVLHESKIPRPAFDLVLELLTRISAQAADATHTAAVQDPDLGIVLEVEDASSGDTVVHVGTSRARFDHMVLTVRPLNASGLRVVKKG